MLPYKILLLPIMLAIILSIIASGCAAFDPPKYNDINNIYVVKEIHAGHTDQYDFITVYYYDGNQTKSVNNDNYNQRSSEEIQINIYNTNDTTAHLVYVKSLGGSYSSDLPHDVYNLYMPVNMSFMGTDSTYQVASGRSTVQVQTTMS